MEFRRTGKTCKVGDLTYLNLFFYEGTYFEKLGHQGNQISARCAASNPQKGYGLNSSIELDKWEVVEIANRILDF